VTEKEHVSWVKTLKVGDEVCYTVGGSHIGSRGDTRVVLVKKVTPTGMIRVSDGTLFNTRGKANNGTRWIFLEAFNEVKKAQVARGQIVDKAGHSAYVLSSNKVSLSKVSSSLLQELVNLEARISLSLKEPAEETDAQKKLCGCGRESTKVYTDPRFGGTLDVCDDCYDLNECQDQGHGVTGESYSIEECIEILEARGWKSHYD